jgi:putative salt-induced outer membrane protein YdiY
MSIAVQPVAGTSVATRPRIMLNRCLLASALLAVCASPAIAQAPPKEPPPLWDAQVAASFVGTSGNSDTATTGADFSAHRRGAVWLLDAAATAVLTRSNDVRTAERYFGMARGQRKLSALLGLSAGEKLERDVFAGIDTRSILDAGLTWALVHRDAWTLDGVTSLAWSHESRSDTSDLNDTVGLFQVLSRVPIGESSDITQRFTYYPDFHSTAAYRSELELTAQAAMNAHLALKMGYLLRYSNAPVPGFKKTDSSTTASVVLHWRAATAASAP